MCSFTQKGFFNVGFYVEEEAFDMQCLLGSGFNEGFYAEEAFYVGFYVEEETFDMQGLHGSGFNEGFYMEEALMWVFMSKRLFM